MDISTTAVILTGLAVAGVFDFVVYKIGGRQATISHRLYIASQEYRGFIWSVCFLFGVFLAHVFLDGPLYPVGVWVPLSVLVGLPFAYAATVLVLVARTDEPTAPVRRYRFVTIVGWFAFGAGAAYLFLPG